MELEKRVADMETELKVVKGEIKELLMDIRDLINKSENPFYYNHKHRISVPENKENEIETGNQTLASNDKETDLKQSEGVLETGQKDRNNRKTALEPATAIPRNPSYEVQEQKMERQKNQINEMKAIEPEIPVRTIDMFTMVELMRWVDYAIRTIGHSNLEALLDLYSVTGQLPEETKHVIKYIANLSIEEPACEEKVSMKDNIRVLSQLCAILNPSEFINGIQPLYEDSGWGDEKKGSRACLQLNVRTDESTEKQNRFSD
jgi:archaellum component FlaD/FlaE